MGKIGRTKAMKRNSVQSLLKVQDEVRNLVSITNEGMHLIK